MKQKPSLLFCVSMDLIGCISYVFPVGGEYIDIFWAPISAYIFFKSFGGKTGKIGSFINFVEEALPFLDFFPTYTLAYVYEKSKDKIKLPFVQKN